MIQSTLENPRIAITVRDVMAMIGKSRSAAKRLITRLEAEGLRRKGAGRGTHYSRRQFLDLWEILDSRS